MNYKTIFYTLGMVIGFEGICMILPLICALCYGESGWYSFLICIVICFIITLILTFKKPERKNMFAKEGFVIVSLSWILISVIGALPFLLTGVTDSFFKALFEMVSGFTTTGASVFTGDEVDALPKCIVFWRSFSHWLGGMGVLVFLVAILNLSGGSNMFLLKAESTGPNVSKIVPKVKSSSKILYAIYIIITFAQIVLLLLTGMNFFETLTVTFGTVGTGGFSVSSACAGGYTPVQQWIITIFMILCGIDFSIYYLIVIGKFKMALKSDEAKCYLAIITVATALITVNCTNIFDGVWETIRHSTFQVGSIITTTGYSTVNYELWPEFSKTILVVLMFVGACAGSTGGGVKVSRILILLKTVVKEIKVSAHPKMTHKTLMNGRPVEHETLRAVNVFMVSYIAIFMISLLLISINGFDFTTNATSILATLNNVGPGFNLVGPVRSYGIYNDFSLLVMTFNMLAGRLEIFPLLILFSKYTWKK